MKEYRVVLDDQLAGAIQRVMQVKGWPTMASAVAHLLILCLSREGYL